MPPRHPVVRRRTLWVVGIGFVASIVTWNPSDTVPGENAWSNEAGRTAGSRYSSPGPSLFGGGSAEAADECSRFVSAANVALAEAEKTKSPAKAREALGLLERAARLCPEDPQVPFLAGLACVLLADADGARTAAVSVERLMTARALESNRPASEGANDPRVLYLRALVSRNFGKRPDVAIELLGRIRARDPGFLPNAVMTVLFWSHIDYAIALSEAGDDEGSVKQASLAEAVARSARFDAQEKVDKIDLARHRRAQVLASGSRWAEAQDLLDDLAKRYPNDVHVRFDLSTAYAEQYRLDDAVASWRETLRLLAVDSKYAELLSDAPMRLGVCLCQRGDTAEGMKELQKYVDAHPNDSRGWYYLGKGAVLTDEPCKAVEFLERARALDASCEGVLRELAKLYGTSCPDPKKAKELEEILEKGKVAREAEMKRRHHVRPDKTDGCR